jgi:hypothetical protein
MAVLLMGAAVASVAYPVLYLHMRFVFDPNDPDFNPAVLVPVFLSVFGLKYAISAIHATLLGRRFGQSVMELEAGKIAPGDMLKGVIRCPVHFEPLDDYEIRLRCVQRTRASRTSTNLQDNIREEETLRVRAQGVDPRKGIPFTFVIPAGARSTTILSLNVLDLVGGSDEGVRWILEVKAPLKGLNYYAIFGVHVSPRSSLPTVRPYDTPPPLSLDLFAARLDKLGQAKLGPNLQSLTPADGIAAMVEFYRAERPPGYEGTGQDVLRFSWGPHEEEGAEHFQLSVARLLSLDPNNGDADHWELTLAFHYTLSEDRKALGKGYDKCWGLDDIKRFEKSIRRSKAMKAASGAIAEKVTLGYV